MLSGLLSFGIKLCKRSSAELEGACVGAGAGVAQGDLLGGVPLEQAQLAEAVYGLDDVVEDRVRRALELGGNVRSNCRGRVLPVQLTPYAAGRRVEAVNVASRAV